jgi:hypothetical protein
MKQYFLGLPILLIVLTSIVFTEASLGDEASAIKTRLDEYREKLDNYIIFSNQTILSQIEVSKNGAEVSDVDKLRAFNANLEICKDIQVLLERYYIYLSWLSDLYGLQQLGVEEIAASAIKKEIIALEDRTVASLDFEVSKYLPSFLPEVTDSTVNSLGNDVLKTFSEIKSYIESVRKTS